MNERLRELMIEAGYAAPELAGRAQKLSELIVRECLRVMGATSKNALEQFTYMGDDAPTSRHQIEIKKHFGVEE